jgi:hypothetical protein
MIPKPSSFARMGAYGAHGSLLPARTVVFLAALVALLYYRVALGRL